METLGPPPLEPALGFGFGASSARAFTAMMKPLDMTRFKLI